MTETKEEIVQTTVRMPRSLRKELADAVNSRRWTREAITLDVAFQQAIRQWLGKEGRPTTVAEVPEAVAAMSDEKFELVQEFVRFINDPGEEKPSELFCGYLRRRMERRRADEQASTTEPEPSSE